jgi:hypothetical protein
VTTATLGKFRGKPGGAAAALVIAKSPWMILSVTAMRWSLLAARSARSSCCFSSCCCVLISLAACCSKNFFRSPVAFSASASSCA